MRVSSPSRGVPAAGARSPALVLAIASLTLSCVDQPRDSGPGRYRFEDLGIPGTPRSVIANAVTGTTLLATLFETKGEGRLLERDLESGVQEEHPMDGTTGAYALLIDDDDGVAYVGTFRAAGVWSFDLRTRELSPVEALTPALRDDSHVFALGMSEEGRLYVGTYPTGRVLEYDIRAHRVRDLGQPISGRVYVRELFVGHDGRVYCALGTPAALAVWDPAATPWSTVAEAEGDGPAFATIRREGQALVGSVGGASTVLSSREPEDRWRAGGLGTRVPISFDGTYEIEAGARRFVGELDLEPKQDGMMTMGLFPGPAGDVLGATYWNASLFRIAAGDATITPLGRVWGAEGEFRVGMPIDGDRVLLPGYGGDLFLYSSDRPWRDEMPDPNPRRLGELGMGQHLATAMARRSDGLVAIATPPDYGRRGGAVTLFDDETSTWRTYDGLAGDRSISAVCFSSDGRLYAGTSNTVGHGATRIDEPAELLVIEPETGEVVRSFAPFPDATNVVRLLDLGDGLILGAGNHQGPPGVVFLVDTETRSSEVLHSFDGQLRDLAWWPSENVAVALVWRSGIYLVDPYTRAVTGLPGGPATALPGVAFDALGNGYLHDGTRVYRLYREPPGSGG